MGIHAGHSLSRASLAKRSASATVSAGFKKEKEREIKYFEQGRSKEAGGEHPIPHHGFRRKPVDAANRKKRY